MGVVIFGSFVGFGYLRVGGKEREYGNVLKGGIEGV